MDDPQQPVPSIGRDGLTDAGEIEQLAGARIELTPYEFRRPWMRAFVAVLARTGEVASAARAAGINHKYVHEVRNTDPVFASAWQEALDVSVDLLEQIAIRRATVGEEKVVTRTTRKFVIPAGSIEEGGDPVIPPGARMIEETTVEERVMVRSDALLMFLLKARRPEQFRERLDPQHRPGVGPVTFEVYRFPDTERARAIAALMAEQGELPAAPALPDIDHAPGTNGDHPPE